MKLRTFIVLSLMVTALSSIAQVVQLPYDPVRKVGDKIYSLQPIYEWLKLPISDRTPRPMPEWVGVGSGHSYALDYRVEEIVPEGLMLRSSGERFVSESVSERADYDSHEMILLKNYPYKNSVVDGQKIKFLAIRTGNFQFTDTSGGISTIAAYDYGTPYIPPSPTPEQIAAAKKATKEKADVAKQAGAAVALKANQDAAAKGDAYGLLRMGERYRDGDGVETNLAKAKEYLQKAAAAGSPTAAEELSRLKQ
jgi:hypothetical protein